MNLDTASLQSLKIRFRAATRSSCGAPLAVAGIVPTWAEGP